MNTNFDNLDRALTEVPADSLAAISGGASMILFDQKSLTGVVFGDNGIFYMKGDGKWVQVTKS
jgi:hypothetical protein